MKDKKASDSFTLKTRIAASAELVFSWHSQPGAIQRLLPPWRTIHVIHRDPSLEIGSRVHLEFVLGPFKSTWIAEHVDCQPGKLFSDIQKRGPFAYWHHSHLFHSIDEHNCEMEDQVHYTPPGSFLGRFLIGGKIRREFARGFAYRHRVVSHDLAVLHRYKGLPKQRILVTGATGLIGSHLVPFLRAAGHQVWIMTRQAPEDVYTVHWNPSKGSIEEEKLENFDTVIHLAGENIAGRWTENKKKRIRDSRIEGTRLLVKALSRLSHPPKTLISASAVGYYGDRDDEVLTESSSRGTGFLASVCEDWETAAQDYSHGRVVNARFGIILSPQGGALATMLPPFKMGFGGVVGTGKQYMPWIALDDVVYQLYHLLATEDLAGAVNIVSPNSVTNTVFTQTLGRVLKRPTFVPLPEFAVKLLLGEMGENLLLGSTRVKPEYLQQSHASFAYPELGQCLRHLLGKKKPKPKKE